MNNSFRRILWFNDKNVLISLVFLSLTVWVAHFLNFLHFGLYEDDYSLITDAWHLSGFLENTRWSLLDFPTGRPVGFFLLGLFGFIGERLGGLSLLYMMGFAVVTLNVSLFYILLRKLSTETTALVGALAFGLFPADTTHSFLTHSLSLQVSLTFLLVATLYYLSGKRALSYLVILGSLLTYESPYMVFLAIPLLRVKWDKALAKELFRHVAIMTAIILVVVILRVITGEERVGEMRGNIPGILTKIAAAFVIGPAVSMTQFINAPIRAVFNWNRTLTVVSVASLIIFTWMLRRSVLCASQDQENGLPVSQGQTPGEKKVSPTYVPHMRMWQLYLAGLIMTSLAYALSFTHYPPVASYGRPTSVHLAAAFGGSLLFAGICTQIIAIAKKFRLRIFAVILISLYLSLIMAYRLLIQDDFVRAWQNQRSFWGSVLDVAPDMTEDTIIFVLDKNLPQTTFILSNSWADPIIPAQLFNFPAHWTNPPRVFVVNRIWFKAMLREGDHFKWIVPTASWDAHWEIMPDSNLILLEMQNGKLVRRFGSIKIDGADLHLKDLTLGAKLNYEKGPLFDYLIGGTN
jgi:hypothetical protein